MIGITASLRFSGKLDGDLRKMGVNLARVDAEHVKVKLPEITYQMWPSCNLLANVKPKDCKYLSASCGYRGNTARQEVDDEIANVQQNMSDFVTFIPSIKSSIITVPPEDTAMSGTFVANVPTKEKETKKKELGVFDQRILS